MSLSDLASFGSFVSGVAVGGRRRTGQDEGANYWVVVVVR